MKTQRKKSRMKHNKSIKKYNGGKKSKKDIKLEKLNIQVSIVKLEANGSR